MPFFRMVSPQSRTACWLAASTTTSGLSFKSAFRDSTTATLRPTFFCVALARPAPDVDGGLLFGKHVEQRLADGAVADQRNFQPFLPCHANPRLPMNGATI